MTGATAFNSYFLWGMLCAIGVSILLFLKLPRAAIHLNLIDHPDERKTHEGAVPLIGGIIIFTAFGISALLLDIPLGPLRGLFAGGLLLIIVGVLDDLHELTSVARFIAQILAAIFMAEWGGVRLIDLGWISPSGGLVQLNWWSSLLTIFATVGIINAVNMIDGIDGLAGSLSLVAALSMAILAYLNGDAASMQILLLLVGALGVYLFFNRQPGEKSRWQRVFMGDAGSMFIGFILCWYFIDLSQGPTRSMAPVTALWIFFVPLFDTVAQMFRRILRGQSPFSADREHVHHRLLDMGLSGRNTLLLLLVVSVSCAAIGVASDIAGFSQAFMFYLFLACFGVYFIATYYWEMLCKIISCRKQP